MLPAPQEAPPEPPAVGVPPLAVPPPVDVIVENIESEPLLPALPPPPTVIGINVPGTTPLAAPCKGAGPKPAVL